MREQPGSSVLGAEHGTIAVLGAGIMGRGIARVFAATGHTVRLQDVSIEAVELSLSTMRKDFARSVERGQESADSVDATISRITPVTELADAIPGATLVIEAVPENIELKRSIFATLDELAGDDVLLATNTSALSVTAIASATRRPERVVGMHFFNPVHRMRIVEIVVGVQSSKAAIDRAAAFCTAIGRTSVRVADRAGFATSRISAMVGNEAFHMLMEGVASAEDIDTAMRLALGYPMGPFELVDLVGLDTRLSVLQRLHESLGERFRPSPLLVSLVESGRLGRKTGHGVYRYGGDGDRIPGSGFRPAT
jgi:3-hydroxybutyryl-CoA dehydrogenase